MEFSIKACLSLRNHSFSKTLLRVYTTSCPVVDAGYARWKWSRAWRKVKYPIIVSRVVPGQHTNVEIGQTYMGAQDVRRPLYLSMSPTPSWPVNPLGWLCVRRLRGQDGEVSEQVEAKLLTLLWSRRQNSKRGLTWTPEVALSLSTPPASRIRNRRGEEQGGWNLPAYLPTCVIPGNGRQTFNGDPTH